MPVLQPAKPAWPLPYPAWQSTYDNQLPRHRSTALINDLSPFAGFSLGFDTDSLDIMTSDVAFTRQARGYQNMAAVLMNTFHGHQDADLYWTYTLNSAGTQTPLFEQRHLTFGLVLLPPGNIGGEYIKTHGHYHSCMPGSQIGFPEVYTHYFGELYLLMQRRTAPSSTRLDDCLLYKMIPGQSIMIPPGYAHILINPSTQPGLMAGLYSLDSVHDYPPIDRMRGAGYYLVERDGHESILPNPCYTDLPTLRELTQLDSSPFAPPDTVNPLYTSFVTNPDRYAFLFEPDAARLQFTAEDLRA
jgi:glucose-6-phosphate isomerase